MANNRNSFKLPNVRNNPDRFCHFCGLAVKGNWTRCENDECRTEKKSILLCPLVGRVVQRVVLLVTTSVAFVTLGRHWAETGRQQELS
ncbi:unnamed protein product [Allacma fusca]|uniref:Uncharacterized protein n=1 Tax=Allacma fusca TaxID=39272 RepID=A0A8J2KG43_9HEXA|nr:unnamed protein product [Allacma fusca]